MNCILKIIAGLRIVRTPPESPAHLFLRMLMGGGLMKLNDDSYLG